VPQRRRSLEQISARLERAFPDRPDLRIAPETIYQALYSRASGLSVAQRRATSKGVDDALARWPQSE
jgi:IS30 family transposase